MSNNIIFYIKSVFLIFTFLWLLIICVNKFYQSFASFILLLPFAYFLIGFMYSDCICDELEEDVFKITFVNTGIIISMPILTLISGQTDNSESNKKMLNHVIFLALIFILLSYPHIWVNHKMRHIFKVARSCLETYGVTLYIFALAIIFLS